MTDISLSDDLKTEFENGDFKITKNNAFQRMKSIILSKLGDFILDKELGGKAINLVGVPEDLLSEKTEQIKQDLQRDGFLDITDNINGTNIQFIATDESGDKANITLNIEL